MNKNCIIIGIRLIRNENNALKNVNLKLKSTKEERKGDCNKENSHLRTSILVHKNETFALFHILIGKTFKIT